MMASKYDNKHKYATDGVEQEAPLKKQKMISDDDDNGDSSSSSSSSTNDDYSSEPEEEVCSKEEMSILTGFKEEFFIRRGHLRR
jgi:hypothetical protein